MASEAGSTQLAPRVAFLLPNMGGGGAERVAITLMKEFLKRGHEVDLVLVRAEGELLAHVPSSVTVIDLQAPRFLAALLPLIRYFKQRKPNAIQIRMWPLTVIGLLAHRLAGSKSRVVISDHVALSQQYGHLPLTFRLLKASVRLFYPWADERFLVSSGAADDIARISALPRDKFKVVYNPIPHPPVTEVPADIEALWKGCEARIITVGTLKAQKNHALLISAFALLRRRRSAKLMILGKGPLLAALQQQAEQEGVAEDVLFPGFSTNPTAYMASAKLFVLSSDYEGFGNVLVEAMRLRLSLVSTDCKSGPAEILGSGRFGKLVPRGDPAALADAMDDALDSPTDGVLLAEQAERLSGQGSIDSYFEMMLGASATYQT